MEDRFEITTGEKQVSVLYDPAFSYETADDSKETALRKVGFFPEKGHQVRGCEAFRMSANGRYDAVGQCHDAKINKFVRNYNYLTKMFIVS